MAKVCLAATRQAPVGSKLPPEVTFDLTAQGDGR